MNDDPLKTLIGVTLALLVIFYMSEQPLVLNTFQSVVVADPDPTCDIGDENCQPLPPGAIPTNTTSIGTAPETCTADGAIVPCPKSQNGGPGDIIDPAKKLVGGKARGAACTIDMRENNLRPSGLWDRFTKTVADHPILTGIVVLGLVAVAAPVFLGSGGIFAAGAAAKAASVGVAIIQAKSWFFFGGTALAIFGGTGLFTQFAKDTQSNFNSAVTSRAVCDLECDTGICLADDAFNDDDSINHDSVKSVGTCRSIKMDGQQLYRAAGIGKASWVGISPDTDECCIYPDKNNDGIIDKDEQSNCVNTNTGQLIIKEIQTVVTVAETEEVCNQGNELLLRIFFEKHGCNSDVECKGWTTGNAVCMPVSDKCRSSASSIPLIGKLISEPKSGDYSGVCVDPKDPGVDKSWLGKLAYQFGITKSMMTQLLTLVGVLFAIVLGLMYYHRKTNDKPADIVRSLRRKR